MNNAFNRLDANKYGKFGLGTWNSSMLSRNLNPMNKSSHIGQQSYYKIDKLPHINSTFNNNTLQPITNYKPISTQGNNNRKEPDIYVRPQYTMTDYSNAQVVPYNTTKPIIRPQLIDTYSSLTNRFFTPEILKMQILEEKIQRMEKTHKQDKNNLRDMIQNNKGSQNINGMQIPNEDGNMNNEVDDIDNKEMRRMQLKKEIDKARKKLRLYKNNDSPGNEDDDKEDDDDYDDTNNMSDSFESLKFKKRRKATTTSQSVMPSPNNKITTVCKNHNINTGQGQSLLLPNISPTRRRGSIYAPTINTKQAREEVHDIINLIPNHTAFQLQADSFKSRENLLLIKSGFKEMRADVQSKLEQMELKQKLNLENIRYALERGGNMKLKFALMKYLDKDNVDLDEIEDEIPEYIRNLPIMINDVIIEKEKQRRMEEEMERQKFEEERNKHEEDMLLRVEEEIKMKVTKEEEKKVREEQEEKKKRDEEEEEARLLSMQKKKKTAKKRRNRVESEEDIQPQKKRVANEENQEEGMNGDDIEPRRKRATSKKRNASRENEDNEEISNPKKKSTKKKRAQNQLNDENNIIPEEEAQNEDVSPPKKIKR